MQRSSEHWASVFGIHCKLSALHIMLFLWPYLFQIFHDQITFNLNFNFKLIEPDSFCTYFFLKFVGLFEKYPWIPKHSFNGFDMGPMSYKAVWESWRRAYSLKVGIFWQGGISSIARTWQRVTVFNLKKISHKTTLWNLTQAVDFMGGAGAQTLKFRIHHLDITVHPEGPPSGPHFLTGFDSWVPWPFGVRMAVTSIFPLKVTQNELINIMTETGHYRLYIPIHIVYTININTADKRIITQYNSEWYQCSCIAVIIP